MTFKSSINIRFDLGKLEYFERYMPTPSHAEVLRGVLRGINYKESRAHIVVGPYGTGKSLLGAIIAGIVSKMVDLAAFDILRSKFNQVDDEIYNELGNISNHRYRYLPVILNGYEGNFRQAILSSIMRVLRQHNLPIVAPGIVSRILGIISTWEKEYKQTYKKFVQILSDENKDLELWRIEILNYNEKEIKWFQDIYPTLTSGAELIFDFEEEFIFQVQYILNELSKQHIGLFIMYDEFGRFLQNVPVNQIYQTMQDIQDLAELADHGSDNFHIMYITHKNLRHYFLKYSEEYRNEFQRIEKRYNIYHIENDGATYIRLIQNAINELYGRGDISENRQRTYISYLRKFPIFPGLNQVEIERLVIQGAYPMHPVALSLLPNVSSLFGQNERTLFTFLESRQIGGLMYFITKKQGEVYTAAHLFDYFFPNIEELELEEGVEELGIYQKILKKVPNLDSQHLAVLKFITLWNITGFQATYPLTSDLIAFAMDWREDEVRIVLNELARNKAIRFNSILGYWELFEGSGLDVEEVIEEKIKGFYLKKDKKLGILEEHLEKKFYLANEYNDTKSMTRFASVRLLFGSDILTEGLPSVSVNDRADAIVYLILLDNKNERDRVIEKLQMYRDLDRLYCVPNFSYELLGNQVEVFELISNILLKDKELLKTDPNLKKELVLKKEETAFVIRKFLSRYTDFNEELVWIVAGEIRHIPNEFVLEKILSDAMMKLYPLTPEVRNDSYNRRSVNRVQWKAGCSVIDHVLEYWHSPQFNIKGNGPDYLLYATIFKNNDLDLEKLNEISNQNFKVMRDKLVQLLNDDPTGSLQSFKDIFSNPPFGVREPLIPIYFVSLLRDKWDHLSFYRNNMYIPEINGEKLFSMFDEAEQYQYIYYEFGKEYESLFLQIEKLFMSGATESFMPRHLRAANLILKWLRSLPRFTQISRRMDERLLYLKTIIRKVEVNPNQALEELVNVYRDNLELLEIHVNELEKHCESQKEKFKQIVLHMLRINTDEELFDWANKQSAVHKKQNRLITSILESINWFDVLADRLVGVPFEDWSDNTADMFLVQVRNEIDKIYHASYSKDSILLSIDGRQKAVAKMELSPKSKTLYQNIHRIIINGGRTVPREEIEYLIYKLVEEFIK